MVNTAGCGPADEGSIPSGHPIPRRSSVARALGDGFFLYGGCPTKPRRAKWGQHQKRTQRCAFQIIVLQVYTPSCISPISSAAGSTADITTAALRTFMLV